MAKGVFNRITQDWQFDSWSSTKLSACYSISGRGRSNAWVVGVEEQNGESTVNSMEGKGSFECQFSFLGE